MVLDRSTAIERALEQVLDLQPVDPDEAPELAGALRTLTDRGALVPRRDVAARSRRLRSTRVAVVGSLPGLDVWGLLSASEVRRTDSPEDADVVLVLCTGELDREVLDLLIRRGTSHLVVRLVDGGAILGPFTVPGVTACLRCIDAHDGLRDPDHVAVTARYVRASARTRPDGVADVAEPALATLAAAWAVRDVVTYAEGREPSTWSRTIHFTAEPTYRTEQSWLRHPQCGCTWSAEAPDSGTMEA